FPVVHNTRHHRDLHSFPTRRSFRSLRNWRLMKVATTKAQRKLFFNLRSLKSGSAALTPADVQRVAKELRVKPEEVREMETRLARSEEHTSGLQSREKLVCRRLLEEK